MNWIEMLRPILNEYKDGNLEEPLDGDGVDDLCRIIKAKINLHEGNLTNSEYEQILDGCDESNYIVEESKDDDLPDGLQKYIDGVALNILHRNYHKSTNGIWSKAEVDEEMGDEWIGQDEYYVVNIDFGCQDDTRNESYRESIDVWKDKKTGKWTISDKEKV